jgi:hypothetical protein
VRLVLDDPNYQRRVATIEQARLIAFKAGDRWSDKLRRLLAGYKAPEVDISGEARTGLQWCGSNEIRYTARLLSRSDPQPLSCCVLDSSDLSVPVFQRLLDFIGGELVLERGGDLIRGQGFALLFEYLSHGLRWLDAHRHLFGVGWCRAIA